MKDGPPRGGGGNYKDAVKDGRFEWRNIALLEGERGGTAV